jgi:hypothetical protein
MWKTPGEILLTAQLGNWLIIARGFDCCAEAIQKMSSKTRKSTLRRDPTCMVAIMARPRYELRGDEDSRRYVASFCVMF